MLLACSLARWPDEAVEAVEAVDAVERCDLGAGKRVALRFGRLKYATGTLYALQVAVERL